MPLRWRLVVFGWPALEIATAWWVATIIGWGNLVGVVILSVVVGVVVIRAAGRAAFAELRKAQLAGVMPQGSARAHVGLFLAGLLIAIPGLWSTAIGLILLFPPVRAILMPVAESWIVSRAGIRSQRTIIQGTIIREQTPPQDGEPPRQVEPPPA